MRHIMTLTVPHLAEVNGITGDKDRRFILDFLWVDIVMSQQMFDAVWETKFSSS